ncbi:MAG: hypothetical protein ACKVZJ_11340 [Phycisphaerales bacterium]
MLRNRRSIPVALCGLVFSASALAIPPSPIPGPSVGPDLVMSGLGSGNVGNDMGDVNGFGTSLWGSAAGVFGYSMNTVACNLGDADLAWFATDNRHPVFGVQAYRYRTVDGAGRFEQVGMSWLKHGECGFDSARCTELVFPVPIPQTQPDCDGLGPFRTDIYGAAMNGDQQFLGPRSEINPWTGAFPFPYILQQNQTGSAPYKRLQINAADMSVGGTYVFEVVGIATDEPDANRFNNYSYRTGTFGGTGGTAFTFSGPTFAMQPALNAWRAIDPQVVITSVRPFGAADGQVMLGSRVTQIGPAVWRYEYALFNMNFSAGVAEVSIPLNARSSVTSAGFDSPAYHSGEPYDPAAWIFTRGTAAATWTTAPFPSSPANANALRWSTTYNVRFDADTPPVAGMMSLRAFSSATGGPDGAAFTISAPVPSPPPCRGDFNNDGATTTQDLVFFLARFGTTVPPGQAPDLNNDGQINTSDLTAFLSAFGCS